MRKHFAILIQIAWSLHAATDWPEFRGPHGDGTIADRDLPVLWSEKQNVRWKTAVRGEGWSTPVIGMERVWLTTSLRDGRSLRVVCLNEITGKQVYDVEVFSIENPEPINNQGNTHASPSPVIFNQRLFVSYGRHGQACLEAMTGRVLWRNQQLELSHDNNGAGSSPIVVSNLMIIPCDGTRRPGIAALNCETGTIAWKTGRSKTEGIKKAFSTPLLVSVDEEMRVLSAGSHRISAYRPRDGAEVWAVDIPGHTIAPRPVVHNNQALVCTGFPKPELWAIKLSGQGIVKERDAVAWKFSKQVPEVSSPVVSGNHVFMVSNDGMLTCLDARNGQAVYSERLGAKFFASPVACSGLIYLPSRDGKTFVISAKGRFEVMATNSLNEGCYASPAVSGHALFLRTTTHLYKIEQ